MSAALVRAALELVDPEVSGKKRNKRKSGVGRQPRSTGQDFGQIRKQKTRRNKKEIVPSKEQKIHQNIESLLALSKPVADTHITNKIIQRAIARRPYIEKVETKKEIEKSILFSDEEEEPAVEPEDS